MINGSTVLWIMAGMVMLFFVTHLPENKVCTVMSENYSIQSLALSDEQRISGAFVLGFGGVSSTNNPKYWFYQADSGGFVLESSNAETTILKEDAINANSAFIEKPDLGSNGLCVTPSDYDERWILHVPAGTIIQEYRADVNNK